jgi:hypothetical protein
LRPWSLVAFLIFARAASALPEAAVILPTSEGAAVLEQCSRSVPTRVSGFWEPDPALVEKVDRALLAGLRDRSLADPHLPIPWIPTDYLPQYVGIERGGRRELYVNLAHRHILDDWGDAKLYWRTKAIVICDGGDYYFGVTYDPRAQRFGQAAFTARCSNGPSGCELRRA